jgi:hypothetical protein
MDDPTFSEDNYYGWYEILVSQHQVKKFVASAYVLYTEMLEMDWPDNITDGFLYKCYMNTLCVTVAIIEQSIADIERNGDDELKATAVRALSVLHKMRVKLGGYLLERVGDPAFDNRVNACMNNDATAEEKRTVVEMHRCHLHLQSSEFSSTVYKFETLEDGNRERFDQLLAAVTSNNDDIFIKNIEKCMRSPLIGYVR